MRLVRLIAILLLPVSVACSAGDHLITPDPAASPPPLSNQARVVPRSLAGAPGLTRAQTMRAIALRSRAARNHRPPTEQVIREYAVDGSVRSERVRTAKGWSARPSTLPADLATRPLASYLTADLAGLSAGGVVVQTMVSIDTVDNVPITNVDTLWTNSSTLSSLSIRESSAASFSWVGDVYYNGPGDVGVVELSSSGVVFTEIPGEDGFLEASLNPTDWISAKAEVMVVDGFPGWPSTSGSVRADPNGAVTLAFAFGYRADEDPCASFRYSAIRYAAGGVISAIGGVVSASVFPPAAPWFARTAVTSTGAAVVFHLTYLECRRPKA